jgi:hypothetical protein
MANRFLWPPLILRQINDEHIYHHHVKEKEKNPVPPLVGVVLRTIWCLQLVPHIHTPHMRSVFEVHGRRHDIFLYRLVSPKHRGHRHTRISNGNCVGGQKQYRLLIPCGAFLYTPLFFNANGNPSLTELYLWHKFAWKSTLAKGWM